MAASPDEQRDRTYAEALNLLGQGTARDLRTLQIKITYIGSQTKPIPTVVFTTIYHLMQMDWFLPLRSSNLHYNNDDIAVLNFTVTPDEIQQVVTMLTQLESVRNPRAVDVPYVSLMLVLQESRLGQARFEAVLGRRDAELVIRTIDNALHANNGLAHTVIDLQRQLIFT
jgi:hypothetical protein